MAGRRGAGQLSGSEWATVIDRRLRGEPLAAIAREYRCSVRHIHLVTQPFMPRSRAVAGRLGRAPPSPAALDPAHALRLARVMTRFVATLDVATSRATAANIRDLREWSDQLMRAVARVRIELVGAARAAGGGGRARPR